MNEKVYKSIEITGTSSNSIEEAVDHAIKRTGASVNGLCWFQIIETRGNIENNQVKLWQVTVKIGFEVE